MAVSIFAPVLLFVVAGHVSVIATYHYVSSPILGLLTGILALLDICLLFVRVAKVRPVPNNR